MQYNQSKASYSTRNIKVHYGTMALWVAIHHYVVDPGFADGDWCLSPFDNDISTSIGEVVCGDQV